MRNAKLHSGRLKVKEAVVASKQVSNITILRPSDWIVTAGLVSGTVATSAVVGHTDGLSLPCRMFQFDDAIMCVGFNSVVPSNIPKNVQLDVKLYWTTSGVWAKMSGTGVVWSLDYRFIDPIVSGALISNNNYPISGAFSNSIVNDNYVGGSPLLSGALNTTIITLPASEVRAGRIVQGLLYRDLNESANTMATNVSLLFIVLEYIGNRSDLL